RRANSGEAFRFSERESLVTPLRLIFHKDLLSAGNLLRKNNDGRRSVSPPKTSVDEDNDDSNNTVITMAEHFDQQSGSQSGIVHAVPQEGHSPGALSSQASLGMGEPSPSPPSCSPTTSPRPQSPQQPARPLGPPQGVTRVLPSVRLEPDDNPGCNEETLENGGTCFEFDTPATQRSLSASSPIAKSVSFHSGTSLPEERKISS
ncbi:inactive phospholipase C protein 2-like, partial [Tropilaelaps mercedesae]